MTVTLTAPRLKEKIARGLRLAMLFLLLSGCRATAVDDSPSAGEGRRAPVGIEAVAVDQDGNVYTANGWNDADVTFTKWDADGKRVYDAPIQVGNGRPDGAAYAIAVDQEYVYCAVSGLAREPWNNRQQIRRFRSKDGRAAPFSGKSGAALVDGQIQLYEWPALRIPATTPKADAELMKAPLRALDVAGSTLYVADALAGKVRMFDTESGVAKGDFAVHLPHAIAVDPIGQVWVGHDHSTIQAFRADGYSGVTYDGLGEVTSLAFGPGAKLYATDAGQVFTLDTAASPAKFVPVLGSQAYEMRGVATDNKGNIVTIESDVNSGGSRLAKWSAERKLLWERSVPPVNGARTGP